MDVLLWLCWPIALVISVCVMGMLAMGAATARSPYWAAAMRSAAVEELITRGYAGRKVTVAEAAMIDRVLGEEPEELDPDSDARLIDAVRALTNVTDDDLARLEEFREHLLGNAVAAQHSAVSGIFGLRFFAAVWNLRRAASAATVAIAGLRWLLPRLAKTVGPLTFKYLEIAGGVGTGLGVMMWLIGPRHTSSNFAAVVGTTATVTLAAALATAAGVQMNSVAKAWWGPRDQWTRKGVLLAIAVGMGFAGFEMMIWSGMWQGLSRALSTWATGETQHASTAAGGVLMVGLLIFVGYRQMRVATTPWLKAADRINAAFAGALFVCMALVVVAVMIHAPRILIARAGTAFGIAMLGFGLVSAGGSTIGWFQDRRFLRQQGFEVPRRGFRLWAVGAWIIGGFVLSIMPSWIDHNRVRDDGAYAVLSLAYVAMAMAWVLAFLPGAVATLFYVRRVTKSAIRLRQQTTLRTDDETLSPSTAGDCSQGFR